jgi:hypothetical protein
MITLGSFHLSEEMFQLSIFPVRANQGSPYAAEGSEKEEEFGRANPEAKTEVIRKRKQSNPVTMFRTMTS